MSISGGNKQNGPNKLANGRLLDEEEREQLIGNPRVAPGSRQPAQDRLKRLQSNLKRVQNKKLPVKATQAKRHVPFVRPRRATSSVAAAQGSPTNPAQNSNAWEKPKALLDASNRLKAGPTESANQRLTRLRSSLQQERNNNDVSRINEEDSKQPEPMEWEEDSKEETNDILLMRQASQDEELPKRLTDHMYFVLDTNVLMHNIKFVEQLTDLMLPGTVGSMLYIPYIVIKELDKLKGQHYHASEVADPKRLIAVRAIRYLNTKFDMSLEIQAQSAVEEAEHLIEVGCPDDSIVNCCLQLRDQVPHMLLLTNDANLRLKANASGIRVSCCSDLRADYPDEFAALGD
ncbi:uncharacterized protein Swt1 [Drosophila takahashii]|uniref:uncharacterized protein Swt1 n=1 Tax=Drosophila takahashii TaxID=29030 RepID=UPI001CF823B2|nr:uncharacterized protein LOC108066954 [Drosophila takahashii]